MRTLGLVGLSIAFLAGSAAADPRRYADDPTDGVALPMSALSGDQDATATVLDPAGLIFLGGAHLELAGTGLRTDRVEGTGAGLGAYVGVPLAVPFLPRLAVGAAAEWLRPPRLVLSPDPGEPVRLSLAGAVELLPGLSFGAAWRHWVDDSGHLDGTDSLDLGLSARAGAHLAAGLVVRDVATPVVAGVPVERRYALELAWRPTGTDRLEIAVGAALGERRLGVDPRLRLSLRLARGLILRGDFLGRTRFRLADPAFDGGPETREMDLRASLGLEVSFGAFGAAASGASGLSTDGDPALFGGSALLRLSGERLPSIVPRAQHIERLVLKGAPDERSLARVTLRMRALERDPSVVAVLLDLDQLDVGWAGIEELRDGVLGLRRAGKKVLARMVTGSTREVFLAAAADRVYLDAAGGLRLGGLAGTSIYVKDLLDRLGVLAQFEKIEEYKSYPEMFTRDAPSDPAREMRDSILDDTFGQLVSGLAAGRHLGEARVRALIDQALFTADEAGKAGLVDTVYDVDPFRADARADLDEQVAKDLGGVYPVTGAPAPERPTAWARPRLAVVFLEDDIVDGRSQIVPVLGTQVSGGDTIAAAIAYAREHPEVVAVVLRVNSPGGSALASEVIAREVFKTRGRKPIIVSMGDVAASGGYFAAAGGDWILAEPGTITGSIGIFTGKFDLSGLLAKLGVTTTTTTRGARADIESLFRPYSDDERAAIKERLRYFYGRFVAAVAAGRKLTPEAVDAVGRGRVWTGAQAKQRGLVDQIGGLADAVALAKQRAGFGVGDPVELVFLPILPGSLLEQLAALAGADAALAPALRLLRAAVPASLWLGGDVPQARLPFLFLER